MTTIIPVGLAHTFRQRIRFGDHQFGFVGATSANGQIRLQRLDTGDYWDGAAWVAAATWLDTTTDAAAKEHRYPFTPGAELQFQTLEVTMRVNNDPSTEETRPVHVQETPVSDQGADVADPG